MFLRTCMIALESITEGSGAATALSGAAIIKESKMSSAEGSADSLFHLDNILLNTAAFIECGHHIIL